MTQLDELVEALRYIAFDKELEEIYASNSVAEKRQEFDGFWGSLVSNRRAAGNMIKQYYGRAEEANLFFTGHKEGWKTDRGMVYVMLGPPMYVEYAFDSQIWHYSYSEQDIVNAPMLLSSLLGVAVGAGAFPYDLTSKVLSPKNRV